MCTLNKPNANTSRAAQPPINALCGGAAHVSRYFVCTIRHGYSITTLLIPIYANPNKIWLVHLNAHVCPCVCARVHMKNYCEQHNINCPSASSRPHALYSHIFIHINKYTLHAPPPPTPYVLLFECVYFCRRRRST